MRKSKPTEEQIVKTLQEAAAGQISQAELCEKHGIGSNTFDTWKRRDADTETEDAKRLKELERGTRRSNAPSPTRPWIST